MKKTTMNSEEESVNNCPSCDNVTYFKFVFRRGIKAKRLIEMSTAEKIKQSISVEESCPSCGYHLSVK